MGGSQLKLTICNEVTSNKLKPIIIFIRRHQQRLSVSGVATNLHCYFKLDREGEISVWHLQDVIFCSKEFLPCWCKWMLLTWTGSEKFSCTYLLLYGQNMLWFRGTQKQKYQYTDSIFFNLYVGTSFSQPGGLQQSWKVWESNCGFAFENFIRETWIQPGYIWHP